MVFACALVMQFFYTMVEGLGKMLMDTYQMDALDFGFARNMGIGLTLWIFNSFRGISLTDDGLFYKHWKPLIISGVCLALGMGMAVYAVYLIPMTIWFVIICTVPFGQAIISYFVFGEIMGVASIIAAILCFGSILFLSFAKPSSTEEHVIEDKGNYHYVLGIALAFLCTLIFVIINTTIRYFKDVD